MTSPAVRLDTAAIGQGTIYTLLAATGFAAVSILTTLATATGLSLATVLAWRYTLAAVVLVGWVGTHAYKRIPPGEMLRFVAIGGFGQALLVYLALSAAMVYGAYIPVMRVLQKDHPVAPTSAYSKIGAALAFLVLSVSDQSFTYQIAPTTWGVLIALTLFSTVLPSVFFLMGLIRLGPVRTAIVSTVEPFLTAVLGVLVLSQALTLPTLLGGALIVGAVVVLQFRRDRVA